MQRSCLITLDAMNGVKGVITNGIVSNLLWLQLHSKGFIADIPENIKVLTLN
jgi:hypothetical protein